MRIDELKDQVHGIPAKQEVFIRIGDDAYPAKIRLFKEGDKVIPYIDIDHSRLDEHRNFPKAYGGTEEL